MRIIIVDDEWLGMLGMKHSIQKSAPPGAKVLHFRLPSEALLYAAEQTVDTAFLEMETPQMHGLILAKKLQQLNPRINIIFVSATDSYATDAWKLHASGYLLKPVRREWIARELQMLRYSQHGL